MERLQRLAGSPGEPGDRRRGRAAAAARKQATLLNFVMLVLVLAAAVAVWPTDTMTRRQPRRQNRQLQTPASTRLRDDAADGSLFAVETDGLLEPAASVYPAAAVRDVFDEEEDEEEDPGAVALVAAVASIAGSAGAGEQHGSSSSSNGAPPGSADERTLSFDVCKGFANQRVALLSGLVLAAELDRAVVLPRLLLDGAQPASGPNLVDFGEMYDLAAFVEGIKGTGLRVASQRPPEDEVLSTRVSRQYNYIAALQQNQADQRDLKLDCPSFRVPSDLFVKHERLVFAASNALQPVQRLAHMVGRIAEQVQGGSRGFNALYMHAGPSWEQHCDRWEVLTGGHARDNCNNNTDTVGDALTVHRMHNDLPLLVSLDGISSGDELRQQAMANLRDNNYTVVLLEDIARDVDGYSSLHHEEVALVHYYIAMRCTEFIGNSVSTPTALLIMERWHANKYATYYNGGNIPLELFIPLFPMPWVFTYNDWSSGTEYEQMVRGAVTSAIQAARMKAHCMFSGRTSSPMYQWLVAQGVTIIRHDPAWKEALIQEGRRHREEFSKHFSHLYKTDGALVGAFQRIDIPVLRELDQYNYVLFTDCDVFFRKQLRLIDWGSPLPTAIGMGFERYDVFPYNDGVMLWHMPYMRRTNSRFVKWILSTKNGLYYPGYGPVDQGAFNQFYEREVRGKPISKNFNTMCYHGFKPAARVVHLHGPKPNHYLEYLKTKKCQFKDMCQLGVDNGVCKYFEEYKRFVPDWSDVQELAKLCGNLLAGVFHA